MRDFVEKIQHYRGECKDPHPSVTRFGSFDAGTNGRLTIWQIRCSCCKDYFLAFIAQGDALVTIHLEAPNIKDIVPKLDSLKELARSVRFYDASEVLPDIIKIDIEIPDEAIKEQLLRLTPLGTPREKAYEFLNSRLYKDSLDSKVGELHPDNGDYYAQIGTDYTRSAELRSQTSAPDTIPPEVVVRAFWRFDKDGKLRDVEIRRSTVELKSRQ
jgi:hypothetical protein